MHRIPLLSSVSTKDGLTKMPFGKYSLLCLLTIRSLINSRCCCFFCSPLETESHCGGPVSCLRPRLSSDSPCYRGQSWISDPPISTSWEIIGMCPRSQLRHCLGLNLQISHVRGKHPTNWNTSNWYSCFLNSVCAWLPGKQAVKPAFCQMKRGRNCGK